MNFCTFNQQHYRLAEHGNTLTMPSSNFGTNCNKSKRIRKIKVYLLLASTLISLNTYSQKIIINGEEGYRKLKWSDFKGKFDQNAPFFAYTAYIIKPTVQDVKIIGDSVYIGKFEIAVELDPNMTWAKKDKVSDELLIHEQGHFNIGILCMKEILSLYKKAKFTKANFSTLLQSIITDTKKKYDQMDLKYDNETRHSTDKEQQARWNSFFEEKLRE